MSSEQAAIVHSTGIPQEGLSESIEFGLPIASKTFEIGSFLQIRKFVGLESSDILELLKQSISTRFSSVAGKLFSYSPESIILYGEVPFVRMKRFNGDVICVPLPDTKQKSLGEVSAVFSDEVADFFINFSGICESWPWNAETFTAVVSSGSLKPKVLLGSEWQSEGSALTNSIGISCLEIISTGESNRHVIDSNGELFFRGTVHGASSLQELMDQLFHDIALPFFCFERSTLLAYRHFPAYSKSRKER